MKRLASAIVAAALTSVAIYGAANAVPIAPLAAAAVTESNGLVLAHYYYYHHHYYHHRYWRHHHYRYW
jgi:hypothetical protein